MTPGPKGHGFHACMKVHEFEARQNMKKEPDRADFECFQDFGSLKGGEIRGVT